MLKKYFSILIFITITSLFPINSYTKAVNIISEGCLSGDCGNGIGTYIYSNGSIYSGRWENSKRNGFGIFICRETKRRYIGNFYNGEPNKNIYSVSRDYKPKKNIGFRSGPNGGLMPGCLTGIHAAFYSSGSIYVGEFRMNRRNGYGIFIWNNGSGKDSIHIGYSKNNDMTGDGIRIRRDGVHVKGNFIDGVPLGIPFTHLH